MGQKKRGRPATGESPRVPVRLSPETLARLDAFAEAESLSRSEAMRRLIERGLMMPPEKAE
ncbi:CopG family transcriptional regulator [Sphingomonas tabacisoli]|uniref:CopG family transcriptional regulator n=1 Tax=Sphingomonas tabacisoli TaxID=2249466 RepID=A0ABW4I0D6_9SPHN